MAFRDISSRVNPLAYADFAMTPATQFAAGQQEGANNVLLQRQVARDDATAAALAGYYEAPPDQRGAALNRLAGNDPAQAAQVLAFQQAQAAEAQAARRQEAIDAVALGRRVLESANPEIAFQIIDSDGAASARIRAERQRYDIDGDGEISAEEARAFATDLVNYYEPLAGLGAERTSTDVATMRELGFDLTPEGYAEFQAARGSNALADPTAALLAQMQLEERQARLVREREEAERARTEAARTEAERKESERVKKTQAVNSTGRVLDAWDALDVIEQSAVARPGFGGGARSSVASALSLLGLENPAVATAAEQFQDIATISGAELIKQLGLDPTDTKFRAITQASLSLDKAADTNRVQLQRLARAALEEYDAGRLPLEDAMRARLEGMADWSPSQRAPLVDVPAAAAAVGDAVGAAVDFGRASLAQLQAVDVDALTAPQRAALAKRLDELGL